MGDSAARLRAAVGNHGSARLIVTMKQDVAVEADLTRRQVRQQRAAIETRLDSLDRILAGTTSRVVTEFTVVPAAVAVVDAEGLKSLLADPTVAALTLDREAPMALDVSTGVIDSDLLNTAGVLGNNFEGSTGGAYEVAILDSGVDNQHNAFTGRIVAQACFSATSFCPNGGYVADRGRCRRQLHLLHAVRPRHACRRHRRRLELHGRARGRRPGRAARGRPGRAPVDLV